MYLIMLSLSLGEMAVGAQTSNPIGRKVNLKWTQHLYAITETVHDK